MRCYKLLLCALAMLQGILDTLPAKAQKQDATDGEARPLVLITSPKAKGITYRLDGKDISADLLRGFGIALEKYGRERPVLILVDSRLPIVTVGEVAGTAGKAGFTHKETFVVDHPSGMVAEIKFGRWVQAPQ